MDIIDEAQEFDRKFQEKSLHDFRMLRGEVKEITSLSINGRPICLDCDDEIPPARIAVNPNAVRCIDCQAKKERKYAPFVISAKVGIQE
jgi:DnaK suppressor protein